jgi:hypothetical protein
VAHASTAAGAGRGRVGLAGEPVGRLKRARKENRRGKLCSPREEASGEHTGEEKAAVKEFIDGGGSGGAPAGGDPCSTRCVIPVTASPGQQASREDTIAFGEGKDRATKYSTDGVRRRGDAEAAAPMGLVLECVCWCAAGAKGSAGARARA